MGCESKFHNIICVFNKKDITHKQKALTVLILVKTDLFRTSEHLYFSQISNPMFWPSLVAVSLMSETSAMQPRAQGQLFLTGASHEAYSHEAYAGTTRPTSHEAYAHVT